MKKTLILTSIIVLAALKTPLCASPTLTVRADQAGVKIAPTFVGLFIEDINFNGDGGLYAEKIKNRSFEFPNALMGWTVLNGNRGDAAVIQKPDYNESNPYCLRLRAEEAGLGVSNEGFRGIGIREGENYYCSVFAKTAAPAMSFRVEVVAPDGCKLLEGTFDNIAGDWKNYHILMTATGTEPKARFNLYVTTPGTVDLDMISLFPADTARMTDRPIPGLRKDLVERMAAIKPGFLRFPGGCIVEGMTLANRYQWKNTVGDIADRDTIICRWNLEFKHRLTPDYFQSFGLGFFEYFLLAEQIGAEPMPIINCGMACQFNTGETADVTNLQPYVQDALDLIEFANGPADSRWGRLRAEMGHPEPFNLKFLGIGNEQWGPQYVERYKIFEKALKGKYPDVKLIAATGSDPEIFPNGAAEVKYLWEQWRVLKPDIVDEHFYRRCEWFFENTNYYDSYDPDGPELFIGEYAAMTHGVASPENRNKLITALAEAAFLTGMEKNAAVVTMSAYAPMAGHVDAWQWKPNLFWFDNLTSYATPNYYVQQLFSLHKGERVLPARLDGAKGRLYTCASRSGDEIILKVVNAEPAEADIAIALDGVERLQSPVRVITLAGDPDDENSIQNPTKIAPVETTMKIGSAPRLRCTFKPYSLTVLRFSAR